MLNSANNVYSDPRLDAEKVTSLSSGSQFDVLSNPVCSDGYLCYRIGVPDEYGYGGFDSFGWCAGYTFHLLEVGKPDQRNRESV